MELKELITMLSNFGALGIVSAVLLWQNSKIQNKLTGIIENNTKAMTELKDCVHEKMK